MALQYTTLEAAAKAIRVHPRTIVRALTGEHNTYWTEDINHNRYAIDDIAEAYDMNPNDLRRVLGGSDELITPDEAAKILGIRPRTFRDRLAAGRYKKVGHGGIARYLKSKIIEDFIATSE